MSFRCGAIWYFYGRTHLHSKVLQIEVYNSSFETLIISISTHRRCHVALLYRLKFYPILRLYWRVDTKTGTRQTTNEKWIKKRITVRDLSYIWFFKIGLVYSGAKCEREFEAGEIFIRRREDIALGRASRRVFFALWLDVFLTSFHEKISLSR